MQLLLEHVQKGKTFALWAKYELLGQEEKLVEQYNIRQVILVEGNPQAEWSRARKMAGALAVLVYLAGIFWAVNQGGNDIQALLAALPLTTRRTRGISHKIQRAADTVCSVKRQNGC